MKSALVAVLCQLCTGVTVCPKQELGSVFAAIGSRSLKAKPFTERYRFSSSQFLGGHFPLAKDGWVFPALPNSRFTLKTNLFSDSFGLLIDLLSVSHIANEVMALCSHCPDLLCGFLQALLRSTPQDDLQQRTFVRIWTVPVLNLKQLKSVSNSNNWTRSSSRVCTACSATLFALGQALNDF